MHYTATSNLLNDKRQANMTRISIRSILVLLTASGLVLAQTAPVPPTAAPMQTAGPADAYGQPQHTAGAPAATRPTYGLPQQVTMKAGTFVTVRLNEMLASNKNQPGDSFSGTLAQAIVVDGVVVAQRGQTVFGRVAEADKVKGVSHLGVELTGLTLADGEQISVHSQLISRQGGRTPSGQQAGMIVGTTAVGAAVGAAADRGQGAAIGAGAGAAAGIVGVLATRNHPSVLYPEMALTFQIQSPLTIATGNAPQAFRFVGPEDYVRPSTQVVQRAPVQRPGYYSPYYYGYSPYYYGYSPYYWGPSLYVGGFWGGGFRFGGGFHRFR
jgi:hypothetical protein